MARPKVEITTGDAFWLPADVEVQDDQGVWQKVAITTGSTVKAAVVTADHTSTLIGPITVEEAEVGSDWPNGRIVIQFLEADTLVSTYDDDAVLEVEVEDVGTSPARIETYYLGEVAVTQGQIP